MKTEDETQQSQEATQESPRAPMPSTGFLARGKQDFKQTLKEAANYKELRRTPYGLKPILLITAVSAIYAFDASIFGLVRPEMIRDLEIDLVPLFNALGIVGFVSIFVTIGLAYVADRTRRTYMVGIGAIITGIFSIFTGRSSRVPTLAISRVGDAAGGVAFQTPQFSLAVDYYPPNMRGKSVALQGVLTRVFTLGAPFLVLLIVEAATKDPDAPNWRMPFFISGPLMILAGIAVMLFLKEPIRGYMERKAAGASEEVARRPETPPSLGESWRTVWSIRTLRRLFMADIFEGAGDTIFSQFYIIFIFEQYGLSLRDRVLLGSVVALATLPAGFLAGGLLDVLVRRRPSRVLAFSGWLGVFSALTLFAVALAPPLWVLVMISIVFGWFSALTGPARFFFFSQIIPAHVRTLGLATRTLAAIPAQIMFFIVVNTLVSRIGLQAGMFAASPFVLIGALIALSSAGFFERDLRAAIASQLASEEYRRAKESGKGKLLVCRDVDVEYNGVQVLFNVDFDVEEGQIIALLGTNGAGKSTLLRAISGTQEASNGAIVFDGRDITHVPPHEIAHRNVIHMPGGRGIFPGLTVADNLLLGTWMDDEDSESKKRLEEVYQIFPVLKDRANEKAGLLSGGEQQMVSLAQAFLGKPKLLMIDELSLGLSPAVVQQLIDVVKEIHARGATIIIVEQSVNVALTIADRAIFMEKGEVKFVGETAELLRRPDILRAVYVKGTGALIEGAPAGALRSERERKAYELEAARPILEVKNVSKAFGGIHAVKDVSITLREGESLGLIGPNGAGKTTMFDLITGFQKPDEGQIFFDGVDITSMSPDERSKLRLVRRFQDAKLFPALTVYENLLVALERRLDVKNMVLTALQIPQVRQAERRVRLRADRLIELLELGSYRDKFVRELSTGLRRITDLACVLATEPKVLLLDEPSSGIAQAESEGLAPLLRRVRFETGCSLLIIEHDMPLISSVSDELIAMVQGEVLLRGQPAEVLNDERVIQAYLGTSEEAIKRSGVLK